MKLYIAGPMTGYDLYNFPAFFAAEDALRRAGHDVVNPAQVDIDEGDVVVTEKLGGKIINVTLTDSFDLEAVMARDLALIDECDGIYLLDGWQDSDGARRELHHAEDTGKLMFYEGNGIPPLEDEAPAARWVDDEPDANPKDIAGRAKPQLHLVPPVALVRMAAVMELGAKKYDPYNWRAKAVGYSAYVSAAMRHLAAAFDGEDLDPESGQPHLAHVAACMAILLDADACGALIDDRPSAGGAGDLIRQLS